jgi:hypothetical protein
MADTGMKACETPDETGWKIQSIFSLSQFVHLPFVVF